jgi:hypothetical protein
VGAVYIDVLEQRLGKLMRAWLSLSLSFRPSTFALLIYHSLDWRHEMPTKTRSGAEHDSANIISDQIGVAKPEVKWEKALWRKQPFPDNYVPQSFLAELKALRTYHLTSQQERY